MTFFEKKKKKLQVITETIWFVNVSPHQPCTSNTPLPSALPQIVFWLDVGNLRIYVQTHWANCLRIRTVNINLSPSESTCRLTFGLNKQPDFPSR